MNEFEEIYFSRQRRMWGIDLSLLKDGVYHGDIKVQQDNAEFKGIKEELGLDINIIAVSLYFTRCTSL